MQVIIGNEDVCFLLSSFYYSSPVIHFQFKLHLLWNDGGAVFLLIA